MYFCVKIQHHVTIFRLKFSMITKMFTSELVFFFFLNGEHALKIRLFLRVFPFPKRIDEKLLFLLNISKDSLDKETILNTNTHTHVTYIY